MAGEATGGSNRFGEFLRARRAQADPSALGVSVRSRRRGVRREDVAALAGLSAPYLARLEQGRDRNPSSRVVEELGRALQLDEFELRHLRLLAGHAPAPPRQRSHQVRPGLRLLMSTWDDQPAFVQDRYGTVLAANDLACALCPIFTPGTNVLRWLFLAPQARTCYPDWDDVVHGVVGDVLATSAVEPDDPQFRAMIDELSARSAEFTRLWVRHQVRETTVGLKRFRAPSGEVITLNWECFTVGADDWLFVYFAEPDTPDHDALMRLKVAWSLEQPPCSGAQPPNSR